MGRTQVNTSSHLGQSHHVGRNIYVKLPVNVKESRPLCTSAFESWKQVDFVEGCTEHDLHVAKRKDYRSTLRAF